MNHTIHFIAYYLPQYHPIPENDLWWGKGFTEWTNVTKSKPLFKGHQQPRLPGDLGFYDLRIPEIREEQAKLARNYGIDGFIYYHYWFGNKKLLLERPAEEMLKSGSPDFPFCFCWANESWKGIWHGVDNPKILIEQVYPGEDDIISQFMYLLPFFEDKRYIKIDGKPMFHLYKPLDIPYLKLYMETFNSLAKKHGLNGIYFVATHFPYRTYDITAYGFQAQVGIDSFNDLRYKVPYSFKEGSKLGLLERFIKARFGISNNVAKRTRPFIYDYKEAMRKLEGDFPSDITFFPCVIPNWDNSPRAGNKSIIFKNSTPELWGNWVKNTVQKLRKKNQNQKFIILKSWNEWAEGNYLEPDLRWGHEWLRQFMINRNG